MSIMAGALSHQAAIELSEAFSLFDKNEDGTIDTKDLGSLLMAMGRSTSANELQGMKSEMDRNGSGVIELEDFLNGMAKLEKNDCNEGMQTEEMSIAFSEFDRDGDGYISPGELRQVMAMMGERLTEAQVDEMIKEADTDGDGKINFEEFVKMMSN